MKGMMRARVTSNPFTRPNARPAPRPATAANQALTPTYVMSRAVSTAPTANTEPTERSNPPAMSTIVMPIAMMPIVLMPCSTLKTLRKVKKYGLARDSATQSATSAPKLPVSRTATSRPIAPLEWRGSPVTANAGDSAWRTSFISHVLRPDDSNTINCDDATLGTGYEAHGDLTLSGERGHRKWICRVPESRRRAIRGVPGDGRAVHLNREIRQHRKAKVVPIGHDECLLATCLHWQIEGEPATSAAAGALAGAHYGSGGRVGMVVKPLLIGVGARLNESHRRALEPLLARKLRGTLRDTRLEPRRGQHVEVDAVRTPVRPIEWREWQIARVVVRRREPPRHAGSSEIAGAPR